MFRRKLTTLLWIFAVTTAILQHSAVASAQSNSNATVEAPDAADAPPAVLETTVDDCTGHACYGRVERHFTGDLSASAIAIADPTGTSIDGYGGQMTATMWLGRWIPSRSFDLSFGSLGSTFAMYTSQSGSLNMHVTFETGMRARTGLQRGISFSAAAYAALIYRKGLGSAGSSMNPLQNASPLAYRAEALMHLGNVFAIGLQFTDAYSLDLQPFHRSAGITVLLRL